MNSKYSVDPITLEIIRKSLLATADEMKIVLTRSSHNPIIYEVLDFSVGVFDKNANTLAQAAGLPIFIANLGAAILDGLNIIGEESMEDGDVIITNDPYTTGTHLPDMTIYAPVVYNNTLIGFTGSRAHWVDVGGRAPGGWFTDTQEVFQEGIRLRSIKIVERGRINENILRIITHNVRYPVSIKGDLMAQVAAVSTGAKKIKQIVEKYGLETFLKAIDDMILQSEKYVRSEIKRMKSGIYKSIGYIERINSNDPIKISVKTVVDSEQGEITMDFTGTSPQVNEPINCGSAAAISAARVAFRAVIRPDLPTDEGTYKPLKVVLPKGTVISAEPPAPVSLYGIPLMTLMDTVIRSLSEAKRESVIAGMYDDVDATFIWGIDRRNKRPYIHIEPQPGGWGAKPFEDGENALIAIADGDTYNVPVEVLENRFPLLVEQHSLVKNSGGPGKYRGGLGIARVYYIDHDANTTLTYFRHRFPAWGLFDGYPAGGVNTVVIINKDNSMRSLQMATALKIEAGTRLILISGGGGGWGDPIERDVKMVLEDLENEYINLDQAMNVYGLVINPENLSIDHNETFKRRHVMKKKSPHYCNHCNEYMDPLTNIKPKKEENEILTINLNYNCPKCGSILWENNIEINIQKIFEE